MTEDRSRPREPEDRKLDAGLEAAFAASEHGVSEHSVLQTVARLTGRAPRVLLRDDSSPDAASPVIDARARRDLPLPAGRGNYQLLGEIARGGMGTVVKGHDLDLGRDVALKVLHEKLASDPTTLQRFVEEAQIGGQLQHPGIVPVYELGLMADDRPYFTMKLVKGRTLAALLKARKSPDQDRHRFLTIFEQICQTVAYAHSKGVLHRDLKPANVMVGAFGEVQVVDWGLAKVLGSHGHDDSEPAEGESQVSVVETVRSGDTDGSASQAGSVLGTPAYMPPEQAQGNVEQLDERADVFALGGLLAEILTGKPPYPGQRQVAMTMAARANQSELLERLESCDADADLVELCRHCLAPAAAVRPANAGEVSERIHAQLASLEKLAREAQVEAAEARVRAAEERRRHKLTVILAVAVLALAVGGGGGWVYLDQQRTRAESDRVARILRTESQVEEARAEARVAAAGRDWTEAVTHLERGLALALAGEEGEDLAQEVAAELESAKADAEAVEAQRKLERENAELLAALEQVRQHWGTPNRERDYEQEDSAYGETLFRFRIAPDAEDAEAVAEKIRARGPEMAMELAAVLEEWARVRGSLGTSGEAGDLLRLADLTDPDKTRVELRAAIRSRNMAGMRAAAAQEGLAELPPQTLALLAGALAQQNAFDVALPVYRAGLARHPENYALHMGMQAALINMRPSRYSEALPHLQAARALRPESPGAWSRLGMALSNARRSAEAIPVLLTAIERGGTWPWVYANLGTSQLDLGRYQKAVDSLELAIARRSNISDPLNKGAALIGLGRYDEGIEILEECLERQPGALTWNNFAWFLATSEATEVRDPARAVDLAQRAIEFDRTDGYSWSTLGTALYRTGKNAEAIQALEQATRLVEEEGPVRIAEDGFVLAMAHYQEGDPEIARRWYDRGLLWMKAYGRGAVVPARFRAEAARLLGIEESDDE